MKRASVSRRTVAAYAAAAILGVALGSYRHLVPTGARAGAGVDTSSSAPASSGTPAMQSPVVSVAAKDRAAATAPEAGRSHRVEPSPPVDDEPDRLVFAARGLVLRPAVAEDGSVGFLVVRNDRDRRFSVGDVIVAVNDRPVENSAAGSEFLIASLTNPHARIEIRAAKD